MTDNEKLAASIEMLKTRRDFIQKFKDTHPVNVLLYKIDETLKAVDIDCKN